MGYAVYPVWNIDSGRREVIACLFWCAGPLACTTTVDVVGVYFPGWLISAVAGVVIAYVVVSVLARRPGARDLAQSGLLFCGLTVSVGISIWWILFTRF